MKQRISWKTKQRRKEKRRNRKFCTVYGLYDANGELRYIGQTRYKKFHRRRNWLYCNLAIAIRQDRRLTPVLKWLFECNKVGYYPVEIRAIDKQAVWDVSEIIYIERARSGGANLLNVLRGGNDKLGMVLEPVAIAIGPNQYA